MFLVVIILVVLCLCPQIILGLLAGAAIGQVLSDVKDATAGTPFLASIMCVVFGFVVRASVTPPDPSAQFVSLVQVIAPYLAQGGLWLGVLLLVVSFGMLAVKSIRRTI